MANNGAKKVSTLALQAKEGLEQPKNRYNTETANIKAELRDDKE